MGEGGSRQTSIQKRQKVGQGQSTREEKSQRRELGRTNRFSVRQQKGGEGKMGGEQRQLTKKKGALNTPSENRLPHRKRKLGETTI